MAFEGNLTFEIAFSQVDFEEENGTEPYAIKFINDLQKKYPNADISIKVLDRY